MPDRRSFFLAAVAACLSLASTSTLGAQKVKLVGTTIDDAGSPVAAVELVLRRGNSIEATARSNNAGQFDFGAVTPGTMLVVATKLGYQRRSFEVNVDPALAQQSVQIDLIRVASNLDTVVVQESSSRLMEFNEHRKTNKFGHFFDFKEIRAKSPRYVSELFRTIPGARLTPAPGGGSHLTLRGCRPKVWVDGVQAQDAEVDDVISPEEIAGIEIYPSWAGIPAQYMDRQNRACGAVLIWSRQS